MNPEEDLPPDVVKVAQKVVLDHGINLILPLCFRLTSDGNKRPRNVRDCIGSVKFLINATKSICKKECLGEFKFSLNRLDE
jgi:hypothetical protein